MKAQALIDDRIKLAGNAYADLRLWLVPKPVRGSVHTYKYSLALVADGVCMLRYDNEAGKGDHKHYGGVESAYLFTSPQNLLADFWRDVKNLENLR